jgi:hypothetical protein
LDALEQALAQLDAASQAVLYESVYVSALKAIEQYARQVHHAVAQVGSLLQTDASAHLLPVVMALSQLAQAVIEAGASTETGTIQERLRTELTRVRAEVGKAANRPGIAPKVETALRSVEAALDPDLHKTPTGAGKLARDDATAELQWSAIKLEKAEEALRESADPALAELADAFEYSGADMAEAAGKYERSSYNLDAEGLDAVVETTRQLRHAATMVGETAAASPSTKLVPSVRAFGHAATDVEAAAKNEKRAEPLKEQLRAVRERTAKVLDDAANQTGVEPEVQTALRQGSAALAPTPVLCQEAGPAPRQQGTSRSFQRVALQALAPCPPVGETAADPRVAEALAVPPAPVPAFASQVAEAEMESLGGVDFTTLGLRYLADGDASGRGVRYAFEAGRAGPRHGDGITGGLAEGLAAARLSSEAFFVWLSLPRSTFWVNLDPRDPRRVVDERLGTTDVGRVLLEADLELKRMSAQLTDPRTRLGARIWREIKGDCVSTRNWIVPGPARVREDGDELYIIDAPLKVQTEAMYRADEEGADQDCRVPKAVHLHNERVTRRLELPLLQRAVNRAPEFADLRRVYLARVAAEWYRLRAREHATTYGHLVDSGDVAQWRTTSGWRPTDTYRAYLRSFHEREYEVTTEERHGNRILRRTRSAGGITLDKVPWHSVSASDADDAWPGRVQHVRASLSAPTRGGPGRTLLLGGQAPARPIHAQRVDVPRKSGPATWLWLAAPAGLMGTLLGLAFWMSRRRRET